MGDAVAERHRTWAPLQLGERETAQRILSEF